MLRSQEQDSILRAALKTIVLSGSGALSPGPLSASAVALGAVYGWIGGLLVALGHMLFELPYVAVLIAGTAFLERILGGKKRNLLEIIAGGFMLFFAYGLISLALSRGSLSGSGTPLLFAGKGLFAPLLVGFVLTALNPYFLAWWLTVGKPIVEEAGSSRTRFAFIYSSHVWMDYAWLGGLALLAYKGRSLSERLLDAVQLVLAALLVYYGWVFIAEGLRVLHP